jgi:DNA polymerase III delta prime subunit
MTPIIIITNNPNQELQKYQSQGFFLKHKISPQKNTITISQIKSLIHQTNLSSSKNERSLFVIESAETMSIPAQNCLLKTLEETKTENQILLFTEKINRLLPTIISRCLIIKTKNDTGTKIKTIIPPISFWSNQPGKIIILTDEILKNNLKEYLENCLNTIHLATQKNPTPARFAIQKNLLLCLNDLDQNINPRLALDHFFLKISSLL